jgi:hypothetical protein
LPRISENNRAARDCAQRFPIVDKTASGQAGECVRNIADSAITDHRTEVNSFFTCAALSSLLMWRKGLKQISKGIQIPSPRLAKSNS